MRRAAFAIALVAGVILVSCTGQSTSSFVPGPASNAPANGMSAESGLQTSAVAKAPRGWAATSTQAFRLLNATDLGVLPATTKLRIAVGLQLRSVKQLNAAITARHRVSSQEFLSTYAPTSADAQNVAAYLRKQGFSSVSVQPNRLLVTASGTSSQAEKAFDTTLHAFNQSNARVYANTAPAYVPAELKGVAIAVLGLNNVRTFTTTPHSAGSATPRPAPTPTVEPPSPCSLAGVFILGLPSPEPEPTGITKGADCLRNYTPADYWRAYNAVGLKAATSVSVAVMAEGNVTQSISDLRVNEQGDGLAQVPVVVKSVGPGGSDTSGDDEWTLDMTASSGMARAVKTIYLYDTTSLTDSDIALEYNRFVTDDLATIGNSSFGGCEYGPYLDGSMVVDDEILAEGAAQGQTMFASTGDTGSFCSVGNPNGVPGGLPLVEYPAASPYTVAVGGTTLITNSNGGYQGEAPWYSGGGGISQFEYSPSWESGVQPVSSTPVGFTFRGLPDIAMDGDLQTGMILYLADAGGWTIIGGTSLSSPLAAGSWARIQETHAGAGYAPPLLYNNYATSTAGPTGEGPPPTRGYGAFHDILVGANGAYTALPGYDYTTGMGSIDVGQLSRQLAL